MYVKFKLASTFLQLIWGHQNAMWAEKGEEEGNFSKNYQQNLGSLGITKSSQGVEGPNSVHMLYA